MIATHTDHVFSDENWIFERKFGGARVLSIRDGRRPQLWSRARHRVDESFPELVEALAELGPGRFVADGEVVAFDGRVSGVAPRAGPTGAQSDVDSYYVLFDLLSLEGAEITGRPLRQRKLLLRNAFTFRDPLRFSEHCEQHGEAFFRYGCALGWQGLIAKRADSGYQGGPSGDWLTLPCVRTKEFVVGGFTEPQGRRIGFGALLVGYHDGGTLRYAGKVGTGYDNATLRALRCRLDALPRAGSPFAGEVLVPTVHWVRPELVIRVGFTEWTRERRLRHPRFAGMRAGKPVTEAMRDMR
ncbi:MAG TPA: ATP-dependent DNA ligase [Actinophytocola sp.]|jgi:DNA ligase D-like protein (predicted ligase)|nr:ATP-dependent DNA ligase [Actinophytocola sp.]